MIKETFRNQILEGEFIFVDEDSRKELNKVNYIQFCCIVELFKELNTHLVSGLHLVVDKKNKTISIGYKYILCTYFIKMKFNGICGLGKCEIKWVKTLGIV